MSVVWGGGCGVTGEFLTFTYPVLFLSVLFALQGHSLTWEMSSLFNQVTEIAPFSQHDLSPSNIYVLDAFFELYILVGARSKAKYPAFRNALDFAQEYAILAAGMEDRPFVPVSTIVLEGIPRDLKACFRKWRDELSPTIMHPPSNAPAASPSGSEAGGRPPSPLKRGRSLRIVPLTQALQALSDE